jgi:hypothetical protein
MSRNSNLEKKEMTLLIAMIFFLASPSAYAITISDYSSFPQDFSNFNLGVLSPVIGDVDPSSPGNEIVLVKNQGSGMSMGTRLYIYYSNGTSLEKVFLNVRSYSSPALGDLDGIPSNGQEIVFSKGQVGPTLDAYYSNGSALWSVSISGEGTSPAVVDLDNDGELEIILGEGSKIGVYYWNSTQMFSYSLGSSTSSAPALGDVDGDGSLEIVGVTDSGSVVVINGDGSLLWSYSTGNSISSSAPAIGDLDGDGDLEIVVATQGKVYVFYGNGTQKSGWPKSLTVSTSSPALGDIDGDGDLEIVIGEGLSSDSRLVAWHDDGSVLFEAAMDSFNVASSPVLADMNGNGRLETIIGYNDKTWDPYLSIVDYRGLVLNTESLVSLNAVVSESSPAVGDFDDDGKTEIVIATEGSDGKIHVLTTNADYDVESAPWPMYRRDGKHSGASSPVAIITSPSDGSSYDPDDSISFNGDGFSIDGALSYEWYSTLDGNFGSGATLSGTGLLSLGTHSVWLRVTDPLGRVDDSVTISVTVVNDPPPASNGGSGPGGGGGGGGQIITGGGFTIFDGKDVLSEPDFKEIMEFFGHVYINKFSFNRLTASLVSIFASRGEVVMLDRLSEFIEGTIVGFESGLNRKENPDVYSEAATYILENRPGFADLVVIRGDLHVDSLVAAPFAQLIGAPIILVRPDEIPDVNYQVLEKMEGKGRIYIIGGSEAVSESVEGELKHFGGTVVRRGGATRYETSIEIAKEVLDLTDSPLVISVSGKEPVLYAATLATKYRAPIIYLDKPPLVESTFSDHSIVEGLIEIESFDTSLLQVISDGHPIATMSFKLRNSDIKDSWIYLRMRGYDSEPEKWIVRLNGNVLAYNVHTKPVASYGNGQFVRFDAGEYLSTDETNNLSIEGTSFNVDDEFYLTGVTLVNVIEAPGKKTEFWIKEGLDSVSYESSQFGTVEGSMIYAMYLDSFKSGRMYFNEEMLFPVTRTGSFFTLKESDVTSRITQENSFESTLPLAPITILAIESSDLIVPTPEPKEILDPHQQAVQDFISEQFDVIGLMYYQDTIEG